MTQPCFCWAQHSVCMSDLCLPCFSFHKRVDAAKLLSSASLNEIDRMGRCHLTFCLLHWVTQRAHCWLSLYSVPSTTFQFSPLLQSEGTDLSSHTPPVALGWCRSCSGTWLNQYSFSLSFIPEERYECCRSTSLGIKTVNKDKEKE